MIQAETCCSYYYYYCSICSLLFASPWFPPLVVATKHLLLPSPEVSCTTNARGKINTKTHELATLDASHLLVSRSLSSVAAVKKAQQQDNGNPRAVRLLATTTTTTRGQRLG